MAGERKHDGYEFVRTDKTKIVILIHLQTSQKSNHYLGGDGGFLNLVLTGERLGKLKRL